MSLRKFAKLKVFNFLLSSDTRRLFRDTARRRQHQTMQAGDSEQLKQASKMLHSWLHCYNVFFPTSVILFLLSNEKLRNRTGATCISIEQTQGLAGFKNTD